MLYVKTGEELSTFTNFVSKFIEYLSYKKYKQALSLIDTIHPDLLRDYSSAEYCLNLLFSDYEQGTSILSMNTEHDFELYHNLSKTGYIMDCELFTQGNSTNITLQFEFLKRNGASHSQISQEQHKDSNTDDNVTCCQTAKKRTEYEIILAPVHVASYTT